VQSTSNSLQHFLPALKNHLLARTRGIPYTGEDPSYSIAEQLELTIVNNMIYSHQVVRFHYTTYDMRRKQDSVNPRSHADIMLPAFDDASPASFWYARVIGVYHTRVQLAGQSTMTNYDFLHVRWYKPDPTQTHTRWRLPRVQFVDHRVNPSGAFGFLNPAVILRSVHIIPAFARGLAELLDGPSIARSGVEDLNDWVSHYVGM
jgi:hypothetical protein